MLTKKLAAEAAETVTSTTLADGVTEADLVVTVALVGVTETEASAETVTADLAVVTVTVALAEEPTPRPSETVLRLTESHSKTNSKN